MEKVPQFDFAKTVGDDGSRKIDARFNYETMVSDEAAKEAAKVVHGTEDLSTVDGDMLNLKDRRLHEVHMQIAEARIHQDALALNEEDNRKKPAKI